jgi:membrane-bound metal-dependent hydrolase YbcI (DUF457 family)
LFIHAELSALTGDTMLTRHHLLLTLVITFLLLVPVISAYPVGSLVLLIGAGVGSIIPDFHMKRPSRLNNPKNLAYALTRATMRFFVPLIMTVSRQALRLEPDPTDKRITHSGLALLIYGICAAIVSGFIFMAPQIKEFGLVAVFLAGTFLGFLLHLLEDACTKKGICPLFPIDARLFLVGTIRPCESADRRIPASILLSTLLAGGLFLAGERGVLTSGALSFTVIAEFILIFAIMFHCSEIKLERRDDRRFRSPKQANPNRTLENDDAKPFKG